MGIGHRLKSILIASLLVCSAGRAADAPDDLQAKFSAATELLQGDKFAEALPLLVDVARMAPDRPGAIWNLGIAAAAVGDKQLALETWLRYRQLMPGELKGIEKVIQSYQALGMNDERDKLRAGLLASWARMPAAERDKLVFYARDQFDAGAMHFVVLEYFEPKGRFGDLYRFTAIDAAKNQVYYFTIESGSEEFIASARERGEIGKDERIYSLDKFEGRTHSTYLLFKALPPYDSIRAMVTAAAEGRLRPVTSSTR